MLSLMALMAALACQADPARHNLPARARTAQAFVPKGWTQESAHQPDLDADGKPDLVLVLAGPDNEARRLLAALATPGGYRNIGEAALPGYPLGPAEVTFTDRKVLVVTDLTGGTTAVQMVARYRYEAAPGGGDGMRYIGLDLTNYSRTNQHDSIHLSYNWLTGDRIEQVDRLTKRGDYAPQKPRRTHIEPTRYFMEDTADPEDFLSTELDHGDSR
jgi:hypothetical protein